MSETVILGKSRYDADAGFPPPGDWVNPGRRDECGWPGPTEDGGISREICPEVPVSTVTQTCPRGHTDLLRSCSRHAREVIGWNGDFVGGTLTCPMCEDKGETRRVSVLVLWDDMRPVAVIQKG